MATPGNWSNCSNSIALFGATGTAGDGILKAIVGDSDFATAYVVTRRSSARIDNAVSRGQVKLIMHSDYLDYSPLKLALRSTTIGYAMLEVRRMGGEIPHGTILENRDVLKYGDSYRQRCGRTATN